MGRPRSQAKPAFPPALEAVLDVAGGRVVQISRVFVSSIKGEKAVRLVRAVAEALK